MPGSTTYLDTPVIPVAAFAGPDQYPLDCEVPTGSPRIKSVSVQPLGIGGGSLMVPFMRTIGYNIRKSIGTAAATGILIAISGTITMIISGKIIKASYGAYVFPSILALKSLTSRILFPGSLSGV